MSEFKSFQQLRDEVVAAHRFEDHPFFRALEHGEGMTREEFVQTQMQIFFAVVYFSRPMAVLAARLPRAELRRNMLKNVFEEHGEGDDAQTHEHTFLTLLMRLGVDRATLDAEALWPEVRAYNAILTATSTHDDVLTATAMYGMIEDLFGKSSAHHAEAIVRHGWLPEDQMIHYGLHEVLDEEHAEDFYALLRGPYAESARARYQIEQGLRLGAYALMELYRGLYAGRTRRWQREVRGPHSLAEGWYLPTE